jgi:hypothetical protein
MKENGAKSGGVKLSFERESVVVSLSCLTFLKTVPADIKSSRRYMQIVRSVRAIGLVEAPAVMPDPKRRGHYFLLDGHLRIEALKEIGVSEVECLVSTDDEAYTYNKRINRLAAIQEHRMVARAIERGVPEERIAEALGMEVVSVRKRSRLLDGISADAAEILKDAPCPLTVFDILRRMAPLRQIEAAELMVGQNNFTIMFAKALLAATPDKLLADRGKTKPSGERAITAEQIARMERELVSLQAQVKSVEENYGIDNLHLTVARGYLRKLLANTRILRWLTQHRPEYLAEFQLVAEMESLAVVRTAAE